MEFIKLGDIVTIKKGKKPLFSESPNERSVRVLQIDDLRNDKNLKFTDDETGVLVDEDDVLLAWDGANAGTVGFGKIGYIGSTIAVLKKKDPKKFSTVFIGKFLQSQFKYLQSKATGATIPHIDRKSLDTLKLPIIDFSDQIRIAEILIQAENLITQRKESIALLDELLKSIFIKRFINIEYPLVKLKDITSKVTDGEHARPNYLETGMPFISVKNISKGYLDFTDCKFVSNDDHLKFNKRCNPEFEDIIYTKVGATYGRAVVVNTTKPFSLYVSVALIKPEKTKINPYFLNAAINHPFVKRQADKSIKGAGVPDLHLIEIKSFEIPFPPIQEQNEFATIVEKIEGLRKEYEASLNELENMYGVLSQKAFKGELNLSKVNLELHKEEIQTPFAGSLEPPIEVENPPVFHKKEMHIKDMSLDDYYNIPQEIIAKYGTIENHLEDWEFILKKFFHDSPIDLNRLEEIYHKISYERGNDFTFEDWKDFIFNELAKSKSYLKQKYNTKTNQLELLINEIKKS